MPPKVSPTLVVLREIRDDIRTLRDDIRTVERGAAETHQRIDNLEVRLASELGSVTAAVLQVRDLLADRLDQRDRIDDHERRIRNLER